MRGLYDILNITFTATQTVTRAQTHTYTLSGAVSQCSAAQCPSTGLGCCLALHHPSSPACLLLGDRKSITASP